MDTGTEADQETVGGNRLIGAENTEGSCRKKPGRNKKENAPEVNLADGLPIVLEHFLPVLLELFRKLPEPIAFDGTEVLRQTNIPHCANCLTAKHSDGRTDYFHQVVDAKLVTEPGLTLSLGFEFIENDGKDYVKQDCELKAFYRLAANIKNRFPRLSICALGDALYACEKVINLLTEYNWSFFISFLPDRIPTLYAEAEAELAANPKNRIVIRNAQTKETCKYSWVNNLKYRGKLLHAVYVDIAGDDEKTMRLAYLTDFRADRNNVVELVNKGGRQRAKIENCFNIQKNHGYNLEHVYGATGSFAEALRHKTFSDIARPRDVASRIQLRFVFGNSS